MFAGDVCACSVLYEWKERNKWIIVAIFVCGEMEAHFNVGHDVYKKNVYSSYKYNNLDIRKNKYYENINLNFI